MGGIKRGGQASPALLKLCHLLPLLIRREGIPCGDFYNGAFTAPTDVIPNVVGTPAYARG
jgi:hypothetical protein